MNDDMWAMIFAPPSGPWAQADLPTGRAVEVEIKYADGSTDDFTLENKVREGDGNDFCAGAETETC